MVFEKVQKLLAEQLNIADVNSITMDSNIVTDLHADSLDVVELLSYLSRVDMFVAGFLLFRHITKRLVGCKGGATVTEI